MTGQDKKELELAEESQTCYGKDLCRLTSISIETDYRRKNGKVLYLASIPIVIDILHKFKTYEVKFPNLSKLFA